MVSYYQSRAAVAPNSIHSVILTHLKCARCGTAIVSVHTVFCGAAALFTVVTLLWPRVGRVIVHIAVAAEPARWVLLVNEAIVVVINPWHNYEHYQNLK